MLSNKLHLPTLLVLLLFSTLLRAATHAKPWVTGRVTAEGQPLAAVVLTLSEDSLGRKMIGFSTSNKQGIYSINSTSRMVKTAWITVRLMGYVTQVVKLDSLPAQRDFELQPQDVKLRGVVVKASARDVKAMGDTLIYDPNKFRTGEERNIGEVINKMPGMKVDAEGNATFQGKRVDKVLVDGQDIVGSASLALNNLPADFAKSVEVIQDYSDDALTQQFASRKQLALNLVSARSITISGKMEAGGGWKEKYNFRLPMLTRVGKMTFASFLGANNTGAELVSSETFGQQGQVSTLTTGAHTFITTAIDPEDQELFSPPASEYDRKVEVANINNTWQATPRYLLKTSLLLTRTRAKGGTESAVTMTDGGLSYTDEMREAKGHKLASLTLQHKWKPNASWSINANTRLRWRENTAVQLRELTTSGTTHRTQNDEKNGSLSLAQSVTMSRAVLGKGLLAINADLSFYTANREHQLHTDETPLDLFYWQQHPEAAMPYQYGYDVRARTADVKGEAQLLYPAFKGKATFQVSAHGQWHTQRDRPLSHTPGWLDEKADWARLGGIVALYRTRGFVRYNFQVDAGQFANYQTAQPTWSYRGYFAPGAAMTLAFNDFHMITLEATHRLTPRTLSEISQRRMLHSITAERSPSLLTQELTRTSQLQLSYSNIDLANGRLIWAMANIAQQHDATITLSETTGKLVRTTQAENGSATSWSAMVNYVERLFRKRISWNHHITYNGQRTPFVLNKRQDEMRFQMLAYSTSLFTLFRQSPINGDLSYNYTLQQQDYAQSALKVKSTSHRITAGVSSNVSKQITLSTSAYVDWWESTNVQHLRFDMNASAFYRPSKRWELSLTGTSLFHLGNHSWQQISFTPESQSYTTYRSLPGSLVLSVAYRL